MANLEQLSYDEQLELKNKALKSGSFMRFGEACDITKIFPENPNSREGLLYQMYLAEKGYARKHAPKEKKYIFPGRTEIPNERKGNRHWYERWIRDFVEANKDEGIKLPKKFGKKSEKQLKGMFYGMLKYYGGSEEDILPKSIDKT